MAEKKVQDSPPRKKIKLDGGSGRCHMNKKYLAEPLMSNLRKCWRDVGPMKDALTSAELLSSPFQCCQLPNFISSEANSESGVSLEDDEAGRDGFLKALVSELLKLKFYKKNNDLYQFYQSNDFKKFKSPCITALRSFFHTECLSWLRDVTDLELSDTVDMTCSKYNYTDTLLCHDDELEGRRIAFILYLVPEWSMEDGGTLDLFDVNDKGQPQSIVKSFVPTWNSMIFFDVNAVSFHQVSEVLSANKTRLSVNGWFHGPPSPRPSPHKPLPFPLQMPLTLGLEVLSDWINPMYLDVGVQSQIQKQFEEDSQIQLPDFILEEKYKMLCEELVVSRTEAKWLEEGPANRKHVSRAVPSSYLPLTQSFMTLLLSKPFCLLLAHMTELELAQDLIKLEGHRLINTNKQNDELQLERGNCTNGVATSPKQESFSGCQEGPEIESDALCRGELHCWRHGDYTLAGDPTDPGLGRFCLEASICFSSSGGEWSEECGGGVTYIASDEDEEFLTVSPSSNSLSLVYRDKDLLRFTKHINHRSKALACCPFFTATATYLENNEGASDHEMNK